MEYVDARRLGHVLAQRGDVIVSGGYGGVMEAVSRGAHEAGGEVLGVTVAPWVGRITPNPYLSEERSARTLFERVEALVESDALIALPGGAGTLGEVALAWNLRQMGLMAAKPVILVGDRWRRLSEAFSELLIVETRTWRFSRLWTPSRKRSRPFTIRASETRAAREVRGDESGIDTGS